MLNDYGPDFATVPIFDLQQLIKSTIHAQSEYITRLRDVCHNIGFFYIRNHGIPSTLMSRMLTLTEAFFNLPQAEKDAVRIALSPHYRGYGKLCAEMTEGIPDYKETYDLGLEQLIREISQERPYLILQGPNQWPVSAILEELQWKETILQYISMMQRIGEQLMVAISLTLGYPQNFFFDQFCSNSEDSYAILRLLKYPPGRISSGNKTPQLGVGPHIDRGCLVILLQDEVGGLQVQNCNGQWVDAPPIKDTYVVNIGEMLQIWSNNFFLATPHRVINTSTKIRHSVPFFFEPNLSTMVMPLEIHPELLKQMTRPKIDPGTRIIYGEHMLKVYKQSFPSGAL